MSSSAYGFVVSFCLLVAATQAPLLAAQGEAALRAESRRLLLEARELAEQSPDAYRWILLHNVAAALVRAGDAAEAQATAAQIGDARERSAARVGVIRTLAAQGDPAVAWQAMEALTDPQERGAALHALAGVQIERRDFSGAQASLEVLESLGAVPVELYSRLAFFQSRTGNTAAAAATMRRAFAAVTRSPGEPRGRNLLLLAGRLSEIAVAQAHLGDAAGAAASTERLKGWLDESPDEFARDSAALHLVRAIAATGNFVGAREQAESIGNAGGREQALAHVAVEQSRAGQSGAARQTMEEITGSGSEGFARHFTALAQAGRNEEPAALETVLALADPSQRANALASLARMHARRDQTGPSRVALDHALEAARQIPEGPAAELRAELAVLRAFHGETDQALREARALPDQALRAQTLGELAMVHARVAGWRAPLVWLEGEASPLARASILAGAAEALLLSLEK